MAMSEFHRQPATATPTKFRWCLHSNNKTDLDCQGLLTFAMVVPEFHQQPALATPTKFLVSLRSNNKIAPHYPPPDAKMLWGNLVMPMSQWQPWRRWFCQ